MGNEKAIRVETGAVVGEPLRGIHVRCLLSWHINSGSDDKTIRICDAETGAAVGRRPEGHTVWVWSVAYSPSSHHVISVSRDRNIQIYIWNTEAPTTRS